MDTNVLVYAIDEDSQFYSQSQDLLFASNYVLFTTSKNLSEFLAVITRDPVVSLSINDALLVLEDFTDIFTILYPTEASFAIFRDLLQNYNPKGLRIHDFEIISIGLAHGINQIATKNIVDFEGIDEISLITI